MGQTTLAEKTRRWMAEHGIRLTDPDQQAAAVLAEFLQGLNEEMTNAVSFADAACAMRRMRRRFDEGFFAALAKATAPGTFFGDFFRVLQPKRERGPGWVEEAEGLIGRYFSRGRVFHADRWGAGVGEAFERERRRRGISSQKLWMDLAKGPLFIAVTELLPKGEDIDISVGEVYKRVRARMRESVETELLGDTLDSKREVPLEEEDLPLPDDILAFETADLRMDLLLAVKRLKASGHLDDVTLFLKHELLEVPYADLAQEGGLKEPAVRKRASRAKAALRKTLPPR